jgi:polyisoprenoid-binding protein YceI
VHLNGPGRRSGPFDHRQHFLNCPVPTMTVLLALILAAGLLVSPAAADPVPAVDSMAYGFDDTQSTMTIYGSSNVRDWTMDVTALDGTVMMTASEAAVPAIQSIDLTIPVQQIVSDKDKLQRHAHEALKKEDYPTISFTATDVQVAEASADSFAVTANGDLTIGGQTRAATITAKGAQTADGTVAVRGDHRLKLSTYDVERPSLFFGAIKVDDPVRLAFDVVLTPSTGPAGSSESR